jgi:hypothetical protein
MKNFKWLMLILFLGLENCTNNETTTNKINRVDVNNTLQNSTNSGYPLPVVITFDSCEYLKVYSYGSNYSLTHKGNCKHCYNHH